MVRMLYPATHQRATLQVLPVMLLARDLPQHQLNAIIKSYLQSSDELSRKKRSVCPSVRLSVPPVTFANYYANSDWHRGQLVRLTSRSCENIAQVPKACGQYSRN